MKYLLFTGEKCPKCKPMKNNLDRVGIKYEEISTDTDVGKMMGGVFRISGVPSLAIARDGRPVHTFPTGLLPIAKLEEIKKKYK